MLKVNPKPLTHEDLFMQCYERLLARAMQMTGHDAMQAEDLVHDVFVQFTIRQPELERLHNLEGYLHTMLRNMHVSQIRRAARLRNHSISLADYDSAVAGLRTIDLRHQLQINNELLLICHYACLRKETSKAGSVLILRFFHGYYPSEIAHIMCSNCRAVDEWVRIARRETKLYLSDPQSLKFLERVLGKEAPAADYKRSPTDLLSELREMIFCSTGEDCPPRERLRERLLTERSQALDCQLLSHIVACRHCLDEVNRLLGLAPLSERYPTDKLGPDKPSNGGTGRHPPNPPGTGSPHAFQQRARRRAKEVFEHRPQQLCISVNGFILGSQQVTSEVSEQSLKINLNEPVNFVEISSEQDVRLLFLNVEPLSEGPPEVREVVQLNDGRTLELRLSFAEPWPTLHISYHDPTLKADLVSPPETVAAAVPSFPAHTSAGPTPASWRERLLDWGSRRWRRFFNLRWWMQPGTITAVLALALITSILFMRWGPTPTVSAAEVLNRSAVSESALAARAGTVLHRTIKLEERKIAGGDLIARRRIEVWHSAEKKIKVRRVYDEQDQLLAGEWRQADGTRTLYRRGARPHQPAMNNPPTTPPDLDEAWQIDLSATSFQALIGRVEQATVEQSPTTYTISYHNEAAGASWRKATLTINKANLHAIEQTLLVQREGEARMWHLIESGFEQHPANAIAPAVFEPDPAFIDSTVQSSTTKGQPAAVSPPPNAPLAESHAVAPAGLEIEVLKLLNQAQADLGEQVSVTRTPEGALQVEAVVDTAQRQAEIRRVLSPVMNHPALKVEISIAGETSRQNFRSPPAKPTVVQEIESPINQIPVEAELRRYFSHAAKGRPSSLEREDADSQADAETLKFAGRTLDRSRQVLRRAWALRRLVSRFSATELRTLDPEARAKLLALIRAHAAVIRRESLAQRQTLQPIFQAADPPDVAEDAMSIADETGLVKAIQRVFEHSSQTDQAVRAAFSISADASKISSAALASTQFWSSLRSAERLAARIEEATQQLQH